ncbi:MAG: ABC transporter ATP-binding protein [Erysipelotrichales bacterium]|nr:ABC transporter ATP-binding protein [Erysipelotrichales bacterium]MBQ4012151.1 ABC transporter ATP-binding protein [Erysipelotrichales bacterium]
MAAPVIEFQDFSFRYKSQNEDTLKHINLVINKGEKVLILGPSGSGKSTLANCINGLIPFSYPGEITGSCKVAGIETQEANLFTLSNHVGTVQQDSDAQFIGLSVGEDIAFSLENDCVPRSEMLGKVEEAAHTVDMDGFLEELPYDLSGGQKQKVALGGVLHNDVEILLFDEPLAALDPAMGMTAVDLIDRIYREKNKTVLIIEHRLEDVLYRHVDRIILINDGQIALDTTPDDLLRSNVLKDMGIREPLYISALKNAGCVFGPEDRLADLDELDISLYRENLVRHFEEQKPSLKNEVPSGEELLNVDHVTFSYGDFTALKNISFRVKKGERISVIGKNGAGKSTMAKLLCGIIRPDEGTVTFRGVNCVQYSIRELGQKIGYVMQNPNQMLVKDMIRDEIQLAMKLNQFPEETIEKNAEEVLKMTDLYPMRNWPISVLSYGQRKRVTIASILSLRPEIVIVDEPTAGQDYKHYTEIMNFLEKLNREYGITILFITHDMHLAIEYTDRSIVFSDGELLADDYVFRVLSDKKVIEKANLKNTSLVLLAEKAGIDPELFIHAFIDEERRNRAHG